MDLEKNIEVLKQEIVTPKDNMRRAGDDPRASEQGLSGDYRQAAFTSVNVADPSTDGALLAIQDGTF